MDAVFCRDCSRRDPERPPARRLHAIDSDATFCFSLHSSRGRVFSVHVFANLGSTPTPREGVDYCAEIICMRHLVLSKVAEEVARGIGQRNKYGECNHTPSQPSLTTRDPNMTEENASNAYTEPVVSGNEACTKKGPTS